MSVVAGKDTVSVLPRCQAGVLTLELIGYPHPGPGAADLTYLV